MKKILFLSFAVSITLMVAAKPVAPDHAVLLARNFMMQYVKGADQMTAMVVYTHPMPKSHQPAMYVVNVGNTFVIVSADDIAHPVLGYSLSRPWPVQTENGKRANENSTDANVMLPSQVSGYLDDLAAQIESAAGQQGDPDRETAAEWRQLTTEHLTLNTNMPDSVGPLLSTTWDQGQYYNALCPEDPNGPDGHVYTGCVATAMAQIINYWGYPVHGRGTHSFDHSIYGSLSVNYDSANYDYANMPNELTATSTPAQVNAVAKLMRDCGMSVDMCYGALGSGAYLESIRTALISHFGYASSLGYAESHMYTYSEWLSLLKEHIDNSWPVCYAGNNEFNAHAFVLDGYKDNDFFHFNFGWSGDYDGWYLITAINTFEEFNFWQEAVLGIHPDSNQAIVCNISPGGNDDMPVGLINHDYYNVNRPIHVYNLTGGTDYKMNYYYGSVPVIEHFAAKDDSSQLVIDVLHIDYGSAIAVYDGTEMDSLLLVYETREWGVYDNQSSDTILRNVATLHHPPIVSTKHGFTIKAYGECMNADEIHLRISDASECRMVSNIKVSSDSNGYHLTWVSDGSSSQWQVQYGDTTVTCDTTFFLINNIDPNTTYEVMIRSVCDEESYSEWNSIVINRRYFWTDIVTSEPEGYTEYADSIVVSTAEGLAWLSRYCMDNYVSKTLVINGDIDLGDYVWGQFRYNGKVKGNGHSILNIHTDYTAYDGGFFYYYSGDTISDLHIVNANSYMGTIAGTIENAVLINCSAENYVIRSKQALAGGLVGIAHYSKLINCYAIGDSYSRLSEGGLVGYNDYSELYNCYSSIGLSYKWFEVLNCATYIKGLLSGNSYMGKYVNCYADIRNTNNPPYDLNDSLGRLLYFCGNVNGTVTVDHISNIATFRVYGDTVGGIIQDTAINYTLGADMDLLTALNNKVIEDNDPVLRTWVWDNELHLPTFGDYYEPTCPNVNNLTAKNVETDNGFAVALSWNEIGEAEEWQVKCNKKNADDNSSLIFTTHTTNDTVEGLQLGNEYLFYVRPICGGEDTVGWGRPYTLYVDKALWIDVVTACPPGYIEDAQGNVTISSAEGLAWMSVMSNRGYRESFYGKTISIVNDIDMGAYRWTPLGWFSGTIEGNNHIISNILCRDIMDENNNYIGFIGNVNGGVIRNLTIKDGLFSGSEYVGALFGYTFSCLIDNCHVENATIYGIRQVGGLGGVLPMSVSEKVIINCSASGTIHADQATGGLIGKNETGGNVFNCYSNCNVLSFGQFDLSVRGGLVGVVSGLVSNCYSAGTVEVDLNESSNGSSFGMIYNSDCGYHNVYAQQTDNTHFGGRIFNVPAGHITDTAFIVNNTLQIPVAISEVSHTDLLAALNAWVDANDTAGIYRHWAADSANVNGGFPVFAAIPCTMVTSSDSIVVCDSYTWHGITYTTSTELIDTLSTIMGCDSIVTHHLIVNHSISNNETVTACEDYFFGGEWISVSGQYTDSLTNTAGCDSIVTLTLTVNNPVHTATTEVACDSYTWQGATITTSGDYTFPHDDVNGCTQVDTLHLTINYSNTSIETVTACDSYIWHGTSYSASTNTPTFTETNATGCDSVVTLNLTVNYSNTGIETVTACDAYTWHGTAYATSTNTPTFTETNATGCDSVVTLNLTVNYSNTGVETVMACDSYNWHGTAYTASNNTATFTETNANGCDSVVTLNLIVNYGNTSIETVTACDSYTWHGTDYTASNNTATFTETNVNGCDSVVTLNLTLNYSNTGMETVTACDNYTWHGNNYTASNNTATFIETNAAGCDSVVTLQLTINQSTAGDTIAVACDAFAWYENFYTASGTHTRYTTNAAGCDSTVTLHLTINSAWCTVTTETACDSYFWYDSTYTTSGTYTYSFVDSNGCSGINTLHLAIVNAVNTAMTETACDTYTWNGTPYTASGNYTYSHLDANGCTQVDTLHLTVNYSDAVNEIDTACEDYFFGGEWITVSGQYTDSLTNIAGCDSIVTLNLTVNNPVHEAVTEVACDSYTWQGATVTVSGDYTFPHDDANGCTQVDTLHLTVNYSVETTVTDTADDSYSWQGTTYTESGTYQWQGTTAEGCDSTVTLMLVINHVGIGEIDYSKMNIDVYPNPTTGQLTIDAEGILSVEVFDPTGRKVATHERANKIDLTKFPAGTYLLKIHLPSGTSLHRVILK